MKEIKLDKKRPYGTVNGSGVSHRYEQDGKKFDGMGIMIPETILEPSPPMTKPKQKTKKGVRK